MEKKSLNINLLIYVRCCLHRLIYTLAINPMRNGYFNEEYTKVLSNLCVENHYSIRNILLYFKGYQRKRCNRLDVDLSFHCTNGSTVWTLCLKITMLISMCHLEQILMAMLWVCLNHCFFKLPDDINIIKINLTIWSSVNQNIVSFAAFSYLAIPRFGE